MSKLASAVCAGGAIYLMAQGINGWGWLLLVAVLLA